MTCSASTLRMTSSKTSRSDLNASAPGSAPGAVFLCNSCYPLRAYSLRSCSFLYAFHRINATFYSPFMQNRTNCASPADVPLSIVCQLFVKLLFYEVLTRSARSDPLQAEQYLHILHISASFMHPMPASLRSSIHAQILLLHHGCGREEPLRSSSLQHACPLRFRSRYKSNPLRRRVYIYF